MRHAQSSPTSTSAPWPDVDVARVPGARASAWSRRSRGADRVVLLGDMLELRERPLAELLERARGRSSSALGRAGRAARDARARQPRPPARRALARAAAARGPARSRRRTSGRSTRATALAGRLAALAARRRADAGLPGLCLRPDVYATHGHYLDLHMTVPRLESIAASAMGRLTRRGRACARAADYEAVLAPMYAFYAGAGPRARRARALQRGGALRAGVWRAGRTATAASAALLLGRVTIPAAVAALNRLGLGPFSPSSPARSCAAPGLLAMGRVAEPLAPGAEHVLVRPHPPRRARCPATTRPSGRTLAGIRLWNSGSWFTRSPSSATPATSPYWPGTVLWVDDAGQPRLENALRDVAAGADDVS